MTEAAAADWERVVTECIESGADITDAFTQYLYESHAYTRHHERVMRWNNTTDYILLVNNRNQNPFELQHLRQLEAIASRVISSATKHVPTSMIESVMAMFIQDASLDTVVRLLLCETSDDEDTRYRQALSCLVFAARNLRDRVAQGNAIRGKAPAPAKRDPGSLVHLRFEMPREELDRFSYNDDQLLPRVSDMRLRVRIVPVLDTHERSVLIADKILEALTIILKAKPASAILSFLKENPRAPKRHDLCIPDAYRLERASFWRDLLRDLDAGDAFHVLSANIQQEWVETPGADAGSRISYKGWGDVDFGGMRVE